MLCGGLLLYKIVSFYIETTNNNYAVVTNFIYLVHLNKLMRTRKKPQQRLEDMLNHLQAREQTKDYVLDEHLSEFTNIPQLNKDPQHASNSPTILLLYQDVSEENIRDAYRRASNKTDKGVFPLFFADQETYLRPAVREEAKVDIRNKRSLRHYTRDALKQAVILSPAERFVHQQHQQVKYFFEPTMLKRAKIRSYTFTPLELRRNQSSRWPGTEKSKRYFFATQED